MIKLKSINKINIPSFDYALVEAYLYIEIPSLKADILNKKIEFLRTAYFPIIEETQEGRDAVIEEGTGLIIEEAIDPIYEVKDKIFLPENKKDRIRYYDEQEVEQIFTLIDLPINPSTGYFEGNINVIKPAILQDLNSDKAFTDLQIEGFEFID